MKKDFQLSTTSFVMLSMIISILLLSCDNTIIYDNSKYITMNVISGDMQMSRVIIDTDKQLQDACTGGAKAIGIWSSYELNGEVKQNVLGNDDGDVALIYQENTAWDNYNWWSYGEKAVLWQVGAKYTFNAYFPMHVVNEISSSDISTFVVEYNTEHYQEDLMMAYSYVDTDAPTFKYGFPVALNMLHTLSALRFRFSFMDSDGTIHEDSDALTEFWLENTEMGKGLATTGILAFGTKEIDGTINGEHIHWYYEYRPEPSTSAKLRQIYPWKDLSGVDFRSNIDNITIATAYTTNTDGKQNYANNNGYILVIPQTTDGTVNICFRLESTGELVHHVVLPITTYEAGKRYTYDIRFGRTNVSLNLSIANWNELKSSQDIPL